MFDSLSLPVLLLIFLGAALLVWQAGTVLSNTTDALDKRFKLGQALGGILILAIVTNLPEIAITVSAALSHKIELAVGNILGGIALQTVVLVLLVLGCVCTHGSETLTRPKFFLKVTPRESGTTFCESAFPQDHSVPPIS